MINSNYYVLDGAYQIPTTVRNARAAQLLHNMLHYNRQVENEQIEPMLLGVSHHKVYNTMFCFTISLYCNE